MYTIKQDIYKANELSEIAIKCKCGHTVNIPVYEKSVICRVCGKKVNNNTKARFKYLFRKITKED